MADTTTCEHVGDVAVDSGLITVGDPCYLAEHADLLAEGADRLPPEGERARRLDFATGSPDAPKGMAGLIVPTWGDHVFPVFVEYDGAEPVRIIVDLDV